MEGNKHALRISLGGLSSNELAELGASRGRPLSPAAAHRLAMHTGGNPAYATALIDELSPEQVSRGWGSLPAPLSVTAMVDSRLSRCSPAAQVLVNAVCVLRSPVPLEIAAVLAGLVDPLAALEEAADAGVLNEVVGGRQDDVRFVDPMVAVAVYYRLGAEARRALHARAVALSDGEAQLVHRVGAASGHREAAATLGDEIEEMAGGELSGGAYELAAVHLDQAASLAHDQVARQRRLRAAAQAYVGLGDAVAAGARLAEVHLGGTEVAEGLIAGELSLLSGRATEAATLLEASWAAADISGDACLASTAAGHLATLALHRVRLGEVMSWADRCGALPSSASAEARFASALGHAIAGETSQALNDLVCQMVKQPWDLGLDLARGALRIWSDDLAGAIADLAGVIAETEGHATHFQARTHALALLSMAEYRFGRWDEAIAHATSSASLSASAGRPWHAALAHSIVVPPLVGRGEWDRAGTHVRVGQELGGRAPGEFVGACMARAQGVLASGLGDHETALAAYTRAEALCDSVEAAFFCDADAKAATLLALGRLDEAREAVGVLEYRAVTSSRRSALAQVARLRAALAGVAGDDLEARLAQLDAGLGHLEGLGVAFEEARLRLDYGQALVEAKRPCQARAQLQAARLVLVALGARPALAICDQALEQTSAELGSDPLECLTPRERQVAQLAEAGLPNCAIAQRLFISAKTVEANLTRIYAKLGITTRRGLGEQVAQTRAHRGTQGGTQGSIRGV